MISWRISAVSPTVNPHTTEHPAQIKGGCRTFLTWAFLGASRVKSIWKRSKIEWELHYYIRLLAKSRQPLLLSSTGSCTEQVRHKAGGITPPTHPTCTDTALTLQDEELFQINHLPNLSCCLCHQTEFIWLACSQDGWRTWRPSPLLHQPLPSSVPMVFPGLLSQGVWPDFMPLSALFLPLLVLPAPCCSNTGSYCRCAHAGRCPSHINEANVYNKRERTHMHAAERMWCVAKRCFCVEMN